MDLGRICLQMHHKYKPITDFCTFEGCKNRWLCNECKKDNLHSHNQMDAQKYLIDHEKLRKYLTNQIKPLVQLYKEHQSNIDKFTKNLDRLKEEIELVKKKCEKQFQNMQELNYLKQRLDRANQGLYEITDDEIDKILNNQIGDVLGSPQNQYEINQITQKSEILLQSFQENVKSQWVQFEKLQETIINIQSSGKSKLEEDKLEYELLKYEYKRDSIFCSQFNQNYMAVSYANQIEIIDPDKLNEQNKGICYSIKMTNIITTLQFSPYSDILFAGDIKGNLFCFDVKSKMNKLYEKHIHEKLIQKIVAINNNQVITCSNDKSIAIVDGEKVTPVSNAHEGEIYGLEYDDQNNVLVSFSSDHQIKFFGCQCEIKCKIVCHLPQIMMTKKFENGKLIQLIKNNNQLLASDGKLILIFDFDCQNKIFQENSKFQMPFGSIYWIQDKFIYIDKEFLQVYENGLDEKNKTFEIKHEISNDHKIIQPRLYNQVNYLIVQSSSKIFVYIRINQHIQENKIIELMYNIKQF